MTFYYPLEAMRHLAVRLDDMPEGVPCRRWVLRDDNQRHLHDIVRLAESPLHIELLWKASPRAREQLVGVYRLDLAELTREGYVRAERADPASDDVRLRFVRGDRGVVVIQADDDGPALPIGTVDMAS